MQKEIKPGTLYFLKGKEEGRGRELIAGLRSAGYRLLIVSPRDPETVMHDLEVSPECVLTLSETVGPYSVDPQNLMVLTDTITKFFELGGKSVLPDGGPPPAEAEERVPQGPAIGRIHL